MAELNYNEIFDRALMEIKVQRNPAAMRASECFYNWAEVKENIYFDFGGQRQEEYSNVVTFARKKSIDTICSLIGYMNHILGKRLDLINQFIPKGILSKAKFIIYDNSTKTIYIFKELEDCCYILSSEPADNIKEIMKVTGADDYKFIYFLKDKAYLQQVGYDENDEDEGKGTSAYPLTYFFEKIFGSEETSKFINAFDKYILQVKEVLGYSVATTLTADASINFKSIVENGLLKYDYLKIGDKKLGKYEIDKRDLPELINQFVNKKYYRILVGKKDFAESFVTAEWMYDSMNNAKAIDLSVIALGYFKTVEQLLFEIIKIYHIGPELNEDAYTLGSIATYYKRFNSYIDEVHPFTRNYIKEAVFQYKDIRNGYSHKHNIKDINKINEIRSATKELIFLILGSHNLSDDKLKILGYEERSYEKDSYFLYEYMNYHAGDAFCVYSGNREIMCFANNDLHAVNAGNHIEYSGMYIIEMGTKEKIKFNDNSLPSKVVLGKLVVEGKNRVDRMYIKKVHTVFEDGKFIGPHANEEIENQY